MSLLKSKFAKDRPRDARGLFIKLTDHQSKEERKRYNRKYHLKHKEKRIQQSVEWGRKNKVRRKITKKKWALANRDHINFLTRMRHFRVKGAEGKSSKSEVDKLFEKHNGLCYYCHRSKANSIDHIVPISRGGTNYINNLVPACISCNSKKGSRLISEFQF